MFFIKTREFDCCWLELAFCAENMQRFYSCVSVLAFAFACVVKTLCALRCARGLETGLKPIIHCTVDAMSAAPRSL